MCSTTRFSLTSALPISCCENVAFHLGRVPSADTHCHRKMTNSFIFLRGGLFNGVGTGARDCHAGFPSARTKTLKLRFQFTNWI